MIVPELKNQSKKLFIVSWLYGRRYDATNFFEVMFYRIALKNPRG